MSAKSILGVLEEGKCSPVTRLDVWEVRGCFKLPFNDDGIVAQQSLA